VSKTRLDDRLVTDDLARSRSHAATLIRDGFVAVDGVVAVKAGQRVGADQTVAVDAEAAQWVARSALKLLHVLDQTGWQPAGATALDIGASTGGFTQVLLAADAVRVFAVDVGRDQLALPVKQDPRVRDLSPLDARDLTAEALEGAAPDWLVMDVSFISLTKILPAVLPLLAPAARAIALVKPQFEVGRDWIGKGGLVRDDAPVAEAVDQVAALFIDVGFTITARLPSPVTGGDGNQEWLLAAERSDDCLRREPEE